MDNKEAFKLKLKSQLEEWEAKFDKLKAETEGAYAEGAIEGSSEYKEAKSKMEELKSELKALEEDGDGKFEEVKDQLENKWNGIKASFDKLKNK